VVEEGEARPVEGPSVNDALEHADGTFEHPRMFGRPVWRALGEELVSPARAARMLPLSLSTVAESIRGSPVSLPA